MKKDHEITWIAQTGTSKRHNRRGQGVGYWQDAIGRRHYVAYTMSMTVSPVSKSFAINLLANMAKGNWTGCQSIETLI